MGVATARAASPLRQPPPPQPSPTPLRDAREGAKGRPFAFLLLALAVFFWAGNWVVGRAVHDSVPPVALNLLRWLPAIVLLAPFVLPGLSGRWGVVRRHWVYLTLLGLTGIALFQGLVYLGLRGTPAINAVLLNTSFPLYMILVTWAMTGEGTSWRQLAGIGISALGVAVIMSQGELTRLLALEFHAGDVWILLALPFWAVYSVLLKRRPAEIGGLELVFFAAVAGCLLSAPVAAVERLHLDWPAPSWSLAAAVAYLAVFPSILSFVFWNRGVAIVGPSTAGLFVHLMPAFGTLLAVLFLGEVPLAAHGVGIAVILAGVALATSGGR